MSGLPKVYSASAGSGKTYTITNHIYDRISSGEIRPDQIIATTFTKKAARELRERIREKLISEGKTTQANQLNQALIGTINSVCLQLLQRYSFEAGLSPDMRTLDENDQIVLLAELLGEVVDDEFLEIAYRLYQSDNDPFSAIKYQEHINKIIVQLKANNLSKEQLSGFAQESIDAYLGLYAGPIKEHDNLRDHVLTLLSAGIDHAAADWDKLSKSAKGSYNDLRNTYRSIRSNTFTWHEWVSLSKIKLAKKYLPDGFHADMTELVNDLLANSLFREHYSSYITGCFAYAAEIIDRYDGYKKKRGLMDFMDQESELYRLLLTNPTITGSISDDYELIVVDEFQDVSPLQLAIFLKCSDMITESVWVGDPKQSIYGFRGADPVLMDAVINYIPADQRETLQHSYRSRASLVHYANHIYTQAFDGLLPSETISLSAAPRGLTGRSDQENDTLDPAIHYWHFDNTGRDKKERRYICLSNEIKKLIDQAPQVFDKGKRTYRTVTYKDIAILCRSNRNTQGLGQVLSDAGMPTAVAGAGLIYEPEIVVIMALLKLLILPTDALAKAEVLLHAHYDGNQAAMIEDRLNYEKNYEWGADHPYIVGLAEIRQQGFNDPTATTIEALISRLNLNELYASWGEMTQRTANVDALLLHTVEYQEMCNRLDMASSIGGLLSHLKQLHATDEDLKGEQSGNAIQVMTYHQSKGLEWPIVFLWDLDHELRDRYYGVQTVSQSEINIDDPLADRSIRLTAKPFKYNTHIDDYEARIDTAPEKTHTDAQRDAEEKRLSYVAVTRARDYLYLCGYRDKTALPDMISPDMNQWGLLDGVHPDVFNWEGQPVKMVKRSYTYDRDIELISDEGLLSRSYFTAKTGRQDYPSERINPSSAEPTEAMSDYQITRIHERHYVDKSGINDAQLGDVIHALICAYDRDIKDFDEIIQHQLSQYGFDQLIDVTWLERSIVAFYDYIDTTYPDAVIHKELPIQSVDAEGHLINGYIDMLIELPDQLVIIDHKTFVMKEYNEEGYKAKAQEYSGQLDLYHNLLILSYKRSVKERIIYFVMDGNLIKC